MIHSCNSLVVFGMVRTHWFAYETLVNWRTQFEGMCNTSFMAQLNVQIVRPYSLVTDTRWGVGEMGSGAVVTIGFWRRGARRHYFKTVFPQLCTIETIYVA